LAPVRLLLSLGLVLSMSGTEVERAQQLARSRESERRQFHRRYLVDLPDATVTQFEVITEFRRLVLLTEEHILRGDWLFSRGARAAEQALMPFRGLVVIRSTIRFNPLNTYITPPPYTLGIGDPAAASAAAMDTRVTPQFATPYKLRGKTVTSLLGATLEADAKTAELGQTRRRLAVILEGKEIARTTVDFAQLD
jgi:hypothetical protein